MGIDTADVAPAWRWSPAWANSDELALMALYTFSVLGVPNALAQAVDASRGRGDRGRSPDLSHDGQ